MSKSFKKFTFFEEDRTATKPKKKKQNNNEKKAINFRQIRSKDDLDEYLY